MNQRLKIFTTGGTIDKIYFDAKSEFQIGEPQIAELLREANTFFDYRVESLLRKDSLDMDDADRAMIRDRVVKDESSRILITHGTDTMVESAMALIGIDGKTIVLTGAMQPARLRVSDAVFNIGYAVAVAQMSAPGVYIAINGLVFDPTYCRKNIPGNRFEKL